MTLDVICISSDTSGSSVDIFEASYSDKTGLNTPKSLDGKSNRLTAGVKSRKCNTKKGPRKTNNRSNKKSNPLADITGRVAALQVRDNDAIFDRLVAEGPVNTTFKSSSESSPSSTSGEFDPVYYSDSSFDYSSPIKLSPVLLPSPIKETSSATSRLILEKPKEEKPPVKPCIKKPQDPKERLQPDEVKPKITKPRVKKNPKGDENLIELSFLSSLSNIPPGFCCHPDALKYQKSFKKNKEELGRVLYKMFNEEVFENQLPVDMEIAWTGKLRNTSGVTYTKSVLMSGVRYYLAKIGLSTQVITTPERLRDTLIHEMCHAATWLVNRVQDGHGSYWKNWTVKARHKLPELPPISVRHEYEIKRKFTYECTQCKYQIGRNTKSLDTVRFRCGYCKGPFTLYTTSTGRPVDNDGPKKPSAFALFVKENYRDVKSENPEKSHKDIMAILGSKYKLNKLEIDGNIENLNLINLC